MAKAITNYWGRVFVQVLFISVLALLMLSSCSLAPEPISKAEIRAQVDRDLEEMFASQEDVDGAISLQEAIARALKYNLSKKVVMMEEAIANGSSSLASYDLLPKLSANAGYTARSNYAGSTSMSLIDGTQSLVASTSQQKSNATGSLGTSWNILDLGVSYATAKQAGNKFLISQQLRRKSVQNIVYDVQVAWWRALVAQQLMSEIDDVLKDTKLALERSYELEKRRIKSPQVALEEQKTLLGLLQRFVELKKQMNSSIVELASLMNLPPGTDYSVAEPHKNIIPYLPKLPIKEVEIVALLNRPELMEANYNKRVSIWDTRKTFLKLFPGVDLSFDYNWDSNKYTVHKNWNDVGARLSWNIMSLVSFPERYRHAKSVEALQDLKRMSLSMAIIAQVNIAWLEYQSTIGEYYLAKKLEGIEGRLKRIADSTRKALKGDELSIILGKARLLSAKTSSGLLLAELHGVVGRIYNSIGIDQMPDEVDGHEVYTLARSIKAKLRGARHDLINEVEESSGLMIPKTRTVKVNDLDSLFRLLAATNGGKSSSLVPLPQKTRNPQYKPVRKAFRGNYDGFFHRMKKGETLYSISEKYNVSVRKIMEINLIDHPDDIPFGRTLWIPERKKAKKRFSRNIASR